MKESSYKEPLLGSSVDQLSAEIKEDLSVLNFGSAKMTQKSQKEMMETIRSKLEKLNYINVSSNLEFKRKEQNYLELTKEYQELSRRTQPFQYQDALVRDDFNRPILEERNKQVSAIELKMMAVSELMKEASGLASLQDHSLNVVASNIDVANNNVNEGMQELSQARESQGTKIRILKCTLICVLVFIAILIPLAVFKYLV
ncbi:unnamed protein product [Blepharisma stoltei]|uniref:t-SNARE coiled-coil homology domain-containing protein n=1 Tax=Blepharisma stoltei TaxID=1481888 RepID=A0AAU9K2I4_9CILI|nr:unnamed protein product [Blepharisma stoltei]